MSEPARTALPGDRASGGRGVLLALLVLGAAAAIPIWIAARPPLQDLPNHLLKVDLLRRWWRGETWMEAVYAPNLRPLSNSTCYAVLLALAPFFDLVTSARILLSSIVVGLPLAAWFFLRRVRPESAELALAVPALNFSLFFMMGNLNFCTALGLYLLALGLYAGSPRNEIGAGAGFAAAATALYFTHGFVFVILAGVVGLLAVLDGRRAWRWRALGLAPGLALLAATLAAAVRSGPGGAALRPDFGRIGLDTLRVGVVWLFNPHGWGFDTPFTLAWLAAFALLAAVALARLARAGRADGWRPALRGNIWLAAGAALALGFLLAPDQLRDWFHLRMRFSPLAALTLLGALSPPRRRPARGLVAAVFVLAALAVDARNVREFRARGAEVEEYVAGRAAVAPDTALLPVENLEPGPKYRPLLHAWAYYVIEGRGWGPYLHAQPSYNPVTYRVPAWGPGEGRPLPGPDSIRRAAACYDYLLLWRPRDEDSPALSRYFEIARATPHLTVWRNRAGIRRRTPSSDPACAAGNRDQASGGGAEDGSVGAGAAASDSSVERPAR